ncbi:hypothetical protein [Pseudomonas virus PBPA162]|uniref:Uncharacterized protein n=1 Tax=Pseudomonas virus PBPA162 TaxID=2588096 RepID=A0A4Y5TPD4_9CAUD|nr:hypothetical protein PQC32_gp65 [Pseudomonas virus PBPA162]QDB70899.1 hypothetical protein [Pseudomonas virus PBPA162]
MKSTSGVDPRLLMDYRVKAVQNLSAMIDALGYAPSACVASVIGLPSNVPTSVLNNTPKGGTTVVWVLYKQTNHSKPVGYVAMHFGQSLIIDSNMPELHACEPELHLKWVTQLDAESVGKYRNWSDFVTFRAS